MEKPEQKRYTLSGHITNYKNLSIKRHDMNMWSSRLSSGIFLRTKQVNKRKKKKNGRKNLAKRSNQSVYVCVCVCVHVL